MKRFSLLIATLLALTSCMSIPASIKTFQPLWVTGIKRDNEVYSEKFPKEVTTAHYKVVNAGYWVRTRNTPDIEVVNEFTLSIKEKFSGLVYTKAVIENPDNISEPIIYEGSLDPDSGSRSTNIFYGPIKNISVGDTYTLRLQVFSDKERSNLIEEVIQKIVSAVSEKDGCISVPKYDLKIHKNGLPCN